MEMKEMLTREASRPKGFKQLQVKRDNQVPYERHAASRSWVSARARALFHQSPVAYHFLLMVVTDINSNDNAHPSPALDIALPVF